jgi:hypothetical protein
MASTAYFEHPITKQIKEAPVGSWNFLVLFLGPIAPLIRGDIKWTMLFFVPLVWLLAVNKYNYWYIKDLVKKGYVVKALPPTMTPEILSAKCGINVGSSR